ncbi:gliding motility-associated C-terminal domain-containing protein [Runella sp.]|uniref:T9SS type B sorting domain-containing protein n=1 Tax=Runella sp. TaxID=1960881 RepID=UPI00260F0566|nr:gliding motility-associated C-terminal domain-containing protein [Runella sp.]
MKTLPWLLTVLTSCAALAQDNIGFERGTFEGWTLSYGNVHENGFVTLFRNERAGTLNMGHKITSAADGPDPRVGIATVAAGSSYSARIGNSSTGSYYDKISTTFVATQEKSLFQYKFAVVLQDPGHPTFKQPAFSILVQIDGEKAPCGFYEVAAGRGIPGFKEKSNLIYRDWTTGSIDLRQYIGKKITISIRAQDCTEGGHWGYAYFDAELIKSEIRTGVYCQEDSTIILKAPDGFAAYEWFNGQKTNQIKTKFNKNSAVFVKVKPFSSLDENCEIRFEFNPATDVQVVSYPFTACEGDILKLSGQTIRATKSETTYVRIPRAGYCDSIVTVHLKVNSRGLLNQKLTICEGDVVKVGSRTYNKSGVYSDTLKRINQCDSIVNTTLMVVALTRYAAKVTMCEEETYMLGDTAIKHGGVYTRRIKRANLCDSVTTIDLSVRLLPRIGISKSICQGDSLMVGNTALKKSGVHLVGVKRPRDCDSLVTVHLTVFEPLPDKEFIKKTQYSLMLGDSVLLTGKPNVAGDFSYDWLPTVGCINCPDIMVKPLDDITYTITYNKGTSCERSIPIKVTVKPCPFFFPDVFTPNGDKQNDTFKVFCGCLERIEQFIVFNRWGEPIHSGKDMSVDTPLWDGMYEDKIAADGPYSFLIGLRYLNGKTDKKRGTVYLMR